MAPKSKSAAAKGKAKAAKGKAKSVPAPKAKGKAKAKAEPAAKPADTPAKEGGTAMGQLGAQAVMDLCKKLAKEGKPAALAEYKGLHTWSDKRQFAKKLMLDKDASFLSVKEDENLKDEEKIGQKEGFTSSKIDKPTKNL